jgi:drug/metabolite transporter (DMT)-like permease
VFFAISAVGYGGATRGLAEGDLILRAGLTLALVTAVQTAVLAAWMAWRERGEMARVFAAWRISAPVGVTSMIGSFCWFAAFSLQNVAYVFAVGQVELILAMAASVLVFREAITRREVFGMALLTAGIVVLVIYL